MACMNDYVRIKFKCGYEPCQHEAELLIYKHDVYDGKVRQCPVCKVWNFKHARLEFPVTPELNKALEQFKSLILSKKSI